MATLYLVATPIGNLEDITERALRILREVECIAAEDTRQTRKLLSHYNIHTQVISYHEHNKSKKLHNILEKLAEGDVALVSDAGTPVLNDPGYELVRAAIDAGYKISPIPGASAPIAALITSGLPPDTFLYIGYLPRRTNERKQKLKSLSSYPFTLICFETPHRLHASLKDILSVFGDRPIAVARELTKIHEEIFRGQVSEAIAHFAANPPRGEITLIIGGAKKQSASERWSEDLLREALQEAITRGDSPSNIAQRIAKQSGWKRREVYNIITEIQSQLTWRNHD